MKILLRLICLSPVTFIGIPLFSFLCRSAYIPIEEKYMPIRPNDAFVYMGLCGWAIMLTVLATVAVRIFSNGRIALASLLVTGISMLLSIRVTGKLFLNYALKRELENK